MKTLKSTLVALIAMSFVAMPAFADGAATYTAKCKMCHGAAGEKNFADVASKSEADLVKITTDGKGKMPSYKGKLSDDDIKGVVAYIKSLKK
jgi:mono/diheme cytochrome c family protein